MFGGLAGSNNTAAREARRKRTVVGCLGRAKSALFEAHVLTRTGGEEAIGCTDSPFWQPYCEIERLWLAEKARLDEPRRQLDAILTNEYGPACR